MCYSHKTSISGPTKSRKANTLFVGKPRHREQQLAKLCSRCRRICPSKSSNPSCKQKRIWRWAGWSKDYSQRQSRSSQWWIGEDETVKQGGCSRKSSTAQCRCECRGSFPGQWLERLLVQMQDFALCAELPEGSILPCRWRWRTWQTRGI